MKYSVIPLLLLWMALPCHGQQDPYYNPNPIRPVVVEAAPPTLPASLDSPVAYQAVRLPVVEVPDPGIPQVEETTDAAQQGAEVEKEDCGCTGSRGCGRCCRCRSRWNVSHRLKSWWQNEAEPYLIDTHWGYPEYFIERPFGSFVEATVQSQVAQGLSEQLVLYHYDFYQYEAAKMNLADASQLTPRGLRQLQAIWPKAICLSERLVIQSSDNAKLDKMRVDRVVAALVEMGEDRDIASSYVIVGQPTAFGLARGGVMQMKSEPEMLWYNQLRNTDQQGAIPLRGGADGGTSQ